ncbi:olfactory receptor 52K2-like [Scleropages formosus]|uniref:olfactory receptor 52K2-like n=1 Tax=Scleropages formosus TaxID=113540 RepID=UPI0010FAC9DA|nr:olfactory receptor 52K2-like [Scleropages formosus]
MENISAVTSFKLIEYMEMEDQKYLYFIVFLLLYILTLCTNLLLISVIYFEKSLHEPMYIFVGNLAVNGIYRSTILNPFLLSQLMFYSYEISLGLCLAQIYCLHTYAMVEFSILAVMGYDRFIAICHPLHYRIVMSPQKVIGLIALSWMYPFIAFGMYFILTAKLTFCSRIIPEVYCANFLLVRLSCFDTSVHSIVGLVATVFLVVPQLLVVMFSYAQILRVCLLASRDSRFKALQTCTPHLLAFVNYSTGCFFEVIQSRFNMSNFPYGSRMFMSLYILIFPPLLNPTTYGISVQNIRVRILKIFPVKK